MKCYGPFIEPVCLLVVVTRQIISTTLSISTLHDSSRNLVSPLFKAQGRREYQLANVSVGRASEASHPFLLRDTYRTIMFMCVSTFRSVDLNEMFHTGSLAQHLNPARLKAKSQKSHPCL